jgi:4-hydroxybenzoate polyprenyltransferase
MTISRVETTSTRLERAFGYGLPSALALLCGYWMHGRRVAVNDLELLLLIIPIGISIPFFAAYSTIFTPRPRTFPIAPEELLQDRDIFIVLSVLGPILAGLGGALPYWLITHTLPPWTLTLALLSVPVLLVLYGGFLLWPFSPVQNLALRYQLIWPILLSIALPFYLGYSFTALKTSPRPLVPFAIFFVYLVTAELWARRPGRLFWVSTAAMTLSAMAAFLMPTLGDMLSPFLFAIAVSAYAAVFESWSATARHAALENGFGNRTYHFYLGTMAALVISFFCVTVLYIVTFLGSFFFWGFGLHSAIAFVIWHRAAPPSRALVDNPNWARYKVTMGLLIFAILVGDSLLGGRRMTTPLEILISTLIATLFVFLWAGLSVKKLMDHPPFTLKELGDYYCDRRRFVENLSPFFLIAFTVSYGVWYNSDRHLNVEQWQRWRLGAIDVFDLYLLLSTAAVIYLFLSRHSGKDGGGVVKQVIGLLLLVRFATSLIVGSGVFLSCWLTTRSSLYSLIRALPFVFACMGGFALNDYYDLKKDFVNRPYRAIPSGRISSRGAFFVGSVLTSLAVLLGAWMGRDGLERTLYVLAGLGVIGYNVAVKYCGRVKSLYTALLASIPFAFIIYQQHYAAIYWFFIAAVIMFITGREIVMDIHDLEGDRVTGVTTWPMTVGVPTAEKASVALQLVGCLALLPIVARIDTPTAWSVGGAIVALSASLSVITLRHWSWSFAGSIYGSWLPMLLGMILLYM